MLPVTDNQKRSVGFDLDTRFLTVPARQASIPTIMYGTKQVFARNASWNLGGIQTRFPGAKTMARVAISHLTTGSASGLDMNGIGKAIITALTHHGMTVTDNMPKATAITLSLTKEEEPYNKVENILTTYQDKEDVPILLIILPYKSTTVYSAIKKVADTKLGLRTICCVQDKIAENFRLIKSVGAAYFSNLALKFQFKSGGNTHHIGLNASLKEDEMSVAADALDGETIVLGADVTHPTKSDDP